MNNTLHIEPGSREEYMAALAEVMVGVRQEPSLVYLNVGEVHDEPGTIVLSERWLDADEYWNEILARPYFRKYLQLSEDVYSAPREVVLLSPVE